MATCYVRIASIFKMISKYHVLVCYVSFSVGLDTGTDAKNSHLRDSMDPT
jgi:hypothetical protein